MLPLHSHSAMVLSEHLQLPHSKVGQPHIANAFAPFLIIFIVGLILGIIFVPDYPEEVGAFRDNNPNMTPEMAENMMLEEIENKKTTVWKLNHTLTTRRLPGSSQFLPGCLLMFSVGMMTQTNAILGSMGNGLAKFGGFPPVLC